VVRVQLPTKLTPVASALSTTTSVLGALTIRLTPIVCGEPPAPAAVTVIVPV
jgi:hypothetical protein